MTDASTTTNDSAAAAVVGDDTDSVAVAVFSSLDDATAAYEQLKSSQDDSLELDGVLVLERDAQGQLKVVKLTDHDTAKGLGWGLLGGFVVGLFFPPALLLDTVIGGAAGSGIGKLRDVHNKKEIEQEFDDAIAPGQSALVALLSDPQAIAFQNAVAKAEKKVVKQVDKAASADLKAAAKAAKEAGN